MTPTGAERIIIKKVYLNRQATNLQIRQDGNVVKTVRVMEKMNIKRETEN